MNIEKRKPRMRTAKGPIKPKQSRMTINQLAIEMRAGFAAVNQKIDKEVVGVSKRIDKIEDILKRNNLK